MLISTIYSRKNQKGFTLLEALVAVSIIAIGLLAAAAMQGVAINSNSIANNSSVATMLTMQVAEDVLSRSITDSTSPLYCQGPPACADTNQNTTTKDPYPFYDVATGTTSTSLTLPGSGTYKATYSIKTNSTYTGNVPGTSMVTVKVYRKKGNTYNEVNKYTTYKRVR